MNYRHRILIVGALSALFMIAAFLVLKVGNREDSAGESPASFSASDSLQSPRGETASDATTNPEGIINSRPSVRKADAGPPKFRSADRGTKADRSKLPVVNVEANMKEHPPWPDGPRVMAEIATESKRFVNLRPNDLGILPTTNVGKNETVVIRFDFPDSAPGDKIYFELVDGGQFLDSDKAGQIRTLGEVKTLEVPITTDSRMGTLKLVLRQDGHTRVIPFWVGAPAPVAGSSI